MFWTGQRTGISVMVSVPKTKAIYPLLGRPHDSLRQASSSDITIPVYEGASFDASATNLTYRLGPDDSIKVILSFLSPITPTSTLRQSMPASYMAIYLEGALDVNIYTDVSGEWVSGMEDSAIEWQLHETSADAGSRSIKSWSVSRRTQLLFTESSDRAEWGTFHFTHGCLNGDNDDRFRRINDLEPTFAFSMFFNLSRETGQEMERKPTKESVVFTLALVHDPVVQFAAARGLTYMRPFWASYFSEALDMLDWHYTDFEMASRLAQNYSQELQVDAESSISQSYGDIVSLSARQVLGATQFSGTPNNPLIFLKEISSNGNFQTVDVIFPAFPFFLYTNPRCMHDIGAHFPNATGHADGKDEYMPVEECGNMLIMALAVANSIKDDSHPAWNAPSTHNRGHFGHQRPKEGTTKGSLPPLEVDEFGVDRAPIVTGSSVEKSAEAWVKRSYSLLRQWTGYLVQESLIPRNQLSTDDFAGWLANQTNLALKGIIGIRAMADLSKLAGDYEGARRYRDISSLYVEEWLGYGLSRDDTHAKLAYTWYGSWTTLYNLFADSVLCFHEAGDSRLPLGVAGKKTRDEITESIALWVNETVTDRPLTDLYDTEGQGDFSPARFMARPVVGGHFARLALERACGGNAVKWLKFMDVDEAEALGELDTKAVTMAEDVERSLEL
ncbi:putative glutaminase [Hirsutella rhossiliensis]|uniref:Glutaminase n=1 Tax=Hirsutella rhossiliensis TaxID=111463 RepID=A0A9P8SK62_9HYPO|nr:putative glutaminase [Hirsutella rhossiliensis]KAH0964430.1 putative glutaminase [Hirsutella rhossiliensis]